MILRKFINKKRNTIKDITNEKYPLCCYTSRYNMITIPRASISEYDTFGILIDDYVFFKRYRNFHYYKEIRRYNTFRNIVEETEECDG